MSTPDVVLVAMLDLRLSLDGRPLSEVAVLAGQHGPTMKIDVVSRAALFQAIDQCAQKARHPEVGREFAELARQIRAQPKRCPVLVLFEDAPPRLLFRGHYLAGHLGDEPADVEARSRAVRAALDEDHRDVLASAVVLEQDEGGWAVRTLSRAEFLKLTDEHAKEGSDVEADERAAFADIARKVRAQPLSCPVVLARGDRARLGWLFMRTGEGGDA